MALCHLAFLFLYQSTIPGRQKSQFGNQVTVNTDFNYSRTLDQSYGIYKFCGISGKGSHSNTLSTRIVWWKKVKIITCTNSSVHCPYNVCAMIVTFVRLGVIFFTSWRQKSHIKIKAKSHKYLVKVSPMTRVPQVEYLYFTVHFVHTSIINCCTYINSLM